MKVTLIRNKKDQSSTGQGRERLIYCNVKDPSLCGVLPIALWALSKESDAKETRSEKFFDGDDQKQKYRHLLNKIYETFNDDPNVDVEILFGCTVDELGTHSHRKGSVTMLLGIIDGPNPCAVYIRACWSLGNTQDRYVMGGGGADELCGRLLAMLNLSDHEFAVLPPHFDIEGLQLLERIGYDRLLKGYKNHSAGYKRCVSHWIAIVLYHLDTLKSWWNSAHPIWGSLFFQTLTQENIIQELRTHIHTGHYHNDITGLTATGVPMIVKILHQQKIQRNLIEEMPSKIINDIISQLTPIIADVPRTIDEAWSSRVSDSDKVTFRDLNSLMSCQFNDLHSMMKDLATTVENYTRNATMSTEEKQKELQHIATYNLRGQYTRDTCLEPTFFTPPSFQVPKCDTAKLFRYWHFGMSLPLPVGPLRVLHQDFRSELDHSQKTLLAKAASVMYALEDIHFQDNNYIISPQNGEHVFEKVMTKLIKRLYPDKLPPGWRSFCFTTIAKKISDCNPNKRKRTRKNNDTY